MEVPCIATQVRQSVEEHLNEQQEWLPNVSSLQGGHTEVPAIVDTFLHHLFSGSDSPLTERMTWLKHSVVGRCVRSNERPYQASKAHSSPVSGEITRWERGIYPATESLGSWHCILTA